MSTVEYMVSREAHTFGSDAMVAAMLDRIATHENTHGGIALYGAADMRAVVTAREAVKASDKAQPGMRDELLRAFRAAGSFWLSGEQSAVLVESLVDYAEGDTPCGDFDGAHHEHVAEVCDCERREIARTWVCEIAATNGITVNDDGVVWA